MIFDKIKKLFSYYLYKENTEEEIVEFRIQYEVIFDCFRQEIIDEIGTKKYEILDDIYMIFDSYEPDEKIRINEGYCINETTLMYRVKELYEKILQS